MMDGPLGAAGAKNFLMKTFSKMKILETFKFLQDFLPANVCTYAFLDGAISLSGFKYVVIR